MRITDADYPKVPDGPKCPQVELIELRETMGMWFKEAQNQMKQRHALEAENAELRSQIKILKAMFGT